MTTSAQLNRHPLDLLERVGSVGAVKATASLSALAGKPVESSFPKVRLIPLEEIPGLLGDPEEVIVGVILGLNGDMSGRFIIAFSLQDAFLLIQTLTGTECSLDRELGEMELSAVSEAGNILASSYLAALEQFAGLVVLPSPPAVAVDMAGAVLTTAVLPLHEAGSEILFVEVRFGDGEHEPGGRMVLVPTTESLPRLLSAVNKSS